MQELELWRKGLGRRYDRTRIKGTGFKLCKIFPRAIKAHISQSKANEKEAKSISGKIERLRPVIENYKP